MPTNDKSKDLFEQMFEQYNTPNATNNTNSTNKGTFSYWDGKTYKSNLLDPDQSNRLSNGDYEKGAFRGVYTINPVKDDNGLPYIIFDNYEISVFPHLPRYASNGIKHDIFKGYKTALSKSRVEIKENRPDRYDITLPAIHNFSPDIISPIGKKTTKDGEEYTVYDFIDSESSEIHKELLTKMNEFVRGEYDCFVSDNKATRCNSIRESKSGDYYIVPVKQAFFYGKLYEFEDINNNIVGDNSGIVLFKIKNNNIATEFKNLIKWLQKEYSDDYLKIREELFSRDIDSAKSLLLHLKYRKNRDLGINVGTPQGETFNINLSTIEETARRKFNERYILRDVDFNKTVNNETVKMELDLLRFPLRDLSVKEFNKDYFISKIKQLDKLIAESKYVKSNEFEQPVSTTSITPTTQEVLDDDIPF